MYSRYFKRIFDLVVASILLIVISPLLAFISLFVLIFIGYPIFFYQLRPGLNEKPFQIYKFRTMLDRRDEKNNLLPDELRLHRFGNILRILSLDELPELINVFKNDMSLIGPRPLLMEYLPYYTARQCLRHKVKPGITGWAQVNGRNHLEWEKKFELDIWYVENCSFWLDCKIIFLTLIKLIKRDGINAINHVTMTRFDLESQKKIIREE